MSVSSCHRGHFQATSLPHTHWRRRVSLPVRSPAPSWSVGAGVGDSDAFSPSCALMVPLPPCTCPGLQGQGTCGRALSGGRRHWSSAHCTEEDTWRGHEAYPGSRGRGVEKLGLSTSSFGDAGSSSRHPICHQKPRTHGQSSLSLKISSYKCQSPNITIIVRFFG